MIALQKLVDSVSVPEGFYLKVLYHLDVIEIYKGDQVVGTYSRRDINDSTNPICDLQRILTVKAKEP